jgi:hypothetical protein
MSMAGVQDAEKSIDPRCAVAQPESGEDVGSDTSTQRAARLSRSRQWNIS